MKKVLIGLPEDAHVKLKQLSEKQGQTISALIRQAIWDYLEKGQTSA